MYRDTVTLQDAVAVILIMECSAATSGGLQGGHVEPDDNLFHEPMQTEFPPHEEADAEFERNEYLVLKRYGMLQHFSGGDMQGPTEKRNHPSHKQNNRDECYDSANECNQDHGRKFTLGGQYDNVDSQLLAHGISQQEQGHQEDCWGRTHSSPLPPSIQSARFPTSGLDPSFNSRHEHDSLTSTFCHGAGKKSPTNNLVRFGATQSKGHDAIAEIEQFVASQQIKCFRLAKEKKKQKRKRCAD